MTRWQLRHQKLPPSTLTLKECMGTSGLLGGSPFSLESSGIPHISQPGAELTNRSEIWAQRGSRGSVCLVNPKSGLDLAWASGGVQRGY